MTKPQQEAVLLIKVLRRRPLPPLNKFQRRILVPILLACAFGLVLCLLCFDYFYFDESSIIYEFSWVHLKLLIKWFLPMAAGALLLVAGMVFFITVRILGPYERVVRELDEIIDSKHKKLLSVRRHDELFSDLLRRINILIKKIPE